MNFTSFYAEYTILIRKDINMKKILKLDIAKQTGWAITDELWYKNHGKIHDYGTVEFWKWTPIIPGNKVDLIFQFVINKYKEEPFDEVWYEELNYIRNLKTVKSLVLQQAGVHLAALKLNIPIKGIPTQASFRKGPAERLLQKKLILVKNQDESDALMLGEGRSI